MKCPGITRKHRDSHNAMNSSVQLFLSWRNHVAQLASSKLLLLGLFVLLALAPIASFGQAISGNVAGTVTDSTGAAVNTAEITATNIGTGVVAIAKPNAAGEYRFDNLLVGIYRIAVKAAGF